MGNSDPVNTSAVLDVGDLHWATSASVVESALMRRPGVTAVQANAVNQTATVTYDPAMTSVVQLADWGVVDVAIE